MNYPPYNPYNSLNYTPGNIPSYNQNLMAQQPLQQTVQQPVQELIRVTGIEGAKAYQMAPNSVVPLFDANNDIMYIKSTDGAGFPSIRAFRFSPMEDEALEPPTEYVPRPEFDKLVEQVEELINAKQPVSRGTKQRQQQ